MQAADLRVRQQNLYNWLNLLSLILGFVAILIFVLMTTAPFDVVDFDFLMHRVTPIGLVATVIVFYMQILMGYFARPGVNCNRLPKAIRELFSDPMVKRDDGTYEVYNARGFNEALSHYRITTNHKHHMRWCDGEYVGNEPDSYPLVVEFGTRGIVIFSTFSPLTPTDDTP